MIRVGYARVSTDDQNLALQIEALKAIGCDPIFSDHGVSGSVTQRPGLDEALEYLSPGHKLVVWRLDRLGRSLVHLVQLLDSLGQRNIRFRSLNENIDTSSSGGRLVFHMMAALAEFERTLISERTRAGMAAARAQGKHIGRPPSLSREQRRDAIQLIETNGLTLHEVAAQYQIHARTLHRLLKLEADPTKVH